MPKKSKTLCVDDLRHAEYSGMQGTFDELYQKSQHGEVFENLMDLLLSRDNILLAYRNIKANKGSYTAGTDKKNITDIGSQKMCIRDSYGVLHCGDCFEVFVRGKWKPTRMEYGDNWYLVGVRASDLNGLRAVSYTHLVEELPCTDSLMKIITQRLPKPANPTA